MSTTDGSRLDGLVQRLSEEFAGSFSRETVERFVREAEDAWADSPVTAYIPVLIERSARRRLREARSTEVITLPEVPEVLFVCVHNAGRSQMAASLLHHHARGRVVVRSAGSAPADEINPAVVAAMAEVGLDLSAEFPKPLTDEAVREADVVVTMGCGDACPIYPGKRYLDWDLADPAGKTLEEVRPIRDEIDLLVRGLLDDLTVATHRRG